MFSWPANPACGLNYALLHAYAYNYSEFPKAFQCKAAYFPYNNNGRTITFFSNKDVGQLHR